VSGQRRHPEKPAVGIPQLADPRLLPADVGHATQVGPPQAAAPRGEPKAGPDRGAGAVTGQHDAGSLAGAVGEAQHGRVPRCRDGDDPMAEADLDAGGPGAGEQVLVQLVAEHDRRRVAQRWREPAEVDGAEDPSTAQLGGDDRARLQVRPEGLQQPQGLKHSLAVVVQHDPPADPPEVLSQTSAQGCTNVPSKVQPCRDLAGERTPRRPGRDQHQIRGADHLGGQRPKPPIHRRGLAAPQQPLFIVPMPVGRS